MPVYRAHAAKISTFVTLDTVQRLWDGTSL